MDNIGLFAKINYLKVGYYIIWTSNIRDRKSLNYSVLR